VSGQYSCAARPSWGSTVQYSGDHPRAGPNCGRTGLGSLLGSRFRVV
jgi:hypothetical protein